jgi:hypothetical protein
VALVVVVLLVDEVVEEVVVDELVVVVVEPPAPPVPPSGTSIAQAMPSQWKPAPQGAEAPAWQEPAPSQSRSSVATPPVHAAGAHTVPAAKRAQAPLPSQVPVVPQVEGALVAQVSCGSEPAITGPQAPFAPCPLAAAEQAWQAPVQAASQHTPSAQKPDVHSVAAAHGEPGAPRS